MAIGAVLDRCVMLPGCGTPPGPRVWGIGGEIVLCCLILDRRHRKSRRSIRASKVAPATPPTIPPARTDVGGVLLPPEPPPDVDVGEAPVAVLLAPPAPPAPPEVLEGVSNAEEPEADDARLWEDIEADVDRNVEDDAEDEVSVGIFDVEDNPELEVNVDVEKPLRLRVAEARAARDWELDREACDAADAVERELAVALPSEVTLLILDDVAMFVLDKVVAGEVISMI